LPPFDRRWRQWFALLSLWRFGFATFTSFQSEEINEVEGAIAVPDGVSKADRTVVPAAGNASRNNHWPKAQSFSFRVVIQAN
jgi:hypothetical protein